jgi:ketosteroid isomerase-like protein
MAEHSNEHGGSHPNHDRVRQGYSAFAGRNLEQVNEFFDENATWHVLNQRGSPLAGDHHGREAIVRMFGRMVEETGNSHRVHVQNIVANDDYAVALVSAKGTRKGKTAGQNEVHVFRLRDGKAVEAWTVGTDDYPVAEFWS